MYLYGEMRARGWTNAAQCCHFHKITRINKLSLIILITWNETSSFDTRNTTHKWGQFLLGTRGEKTQYKLWHRFFSWSVFLFYFYFFTVTSISNAPGANNLQWLGQHISWSNVLYSTVFKGGTWRRLSTGMPLILWIYCVRSKSWRLDHPEGNSSGIWFFKTNQLAWWKTTSKPIISLPLLHLHSN